VDRRDRDRLGRADHDPVRLPALQGRLPWRDDFSWELTNYTILWFAAIGLVFGGSWMLSAKNWFKGPIRQGTEEELERIEEQFERPARGAPAPTPGS
jgi:hypothetical protein